MRNCLEWGLSASWESLEEVSLAATRRYAGRYRFLTAVGAVVEEDWAYQLVLQEVRPATAPKDCLCTVLELRDMP